MAFWFETTDKNWKCGVLYINCSCLLKGLTETKDKQKQFLVENLRLTEVCLFLGASSLDAVDGHICFLNMTLLLGRHNANRPEAVDTGRREKQKTKGRKFQLAQQSPQMTAGNRCLNL